MDTEKLLHNCQTVLLKEEEEEEDIVTFMGKIKIHGERVVANCLVGKVLLRRGINKEGLKTAMQLAGRTVKEVKVESMGDNIFLFKCL